MIIPTRGPRYWVDHRSGCIAVRDRLHPKRDDGRQGLDPEMPDVVKYWGGRQKRTACPACGQTVCGEWEISEESVKAAFALCAQLNGSSVPEVMP